MKVIHVLMFLLLSVTSAGAQGFTIRETRIFTPQSKKIALLKDASNQKKIILFQTKLRVNTDGSPMSYHPGDPRGQTKALNNVCNAIVVRRTNSNSNLCFTAFGQAINVFEQFRDSNFQTVPSGFRITWANVLATVRENGKDVPCVFKTGTFKGYFGSLTALKNGLTTNKGECDVNDQVNPITVPALVLAGGQNPMRSFGARVGDLVLAFNPKTNLFVPAIIGDSGPANNLGEGSILLNMKLLGQTVPPTNKAETFRLSIEDAQVMIAIIPGSRTFQTAKPFTAENIKQRVETWQRESGFSTPESFVAFIKSLEPQIR